MKKTFVLATFIVTCFIACNKDSDSPVPPPTVASLSADRGHAGDTITIAGTNFGKDTAGVVVTFGNDRVAKKLSVGDKELKVIVPRNTKSGPIEINVNNNKVSSSTFNSYSIYTWGFVKPAEDRFKAAYWKDDEEHIIGDDNSYIAEMVVSGNDIHAVGSRVRLGESGPEGAYWKNGTIVTMQSSTSNILFTCVAVSGRNVCIGAWDATGPYYFRNGEQVTLTPRGGPVYDIQISGTDVYVAGTLSTRAGYWKNGSSHVFSGISRGEATAINIVGNDVYIAAEDNNEASSFVTYYKNDLEHRLTEPGKDPFHIVRSIYVSGSDIYVGGASSINNVDYPELWRNTTSSKVGKRTSIVAPIVSISEYMGDMFTTAAENGYGVVFRNGKPLITIDPDKKQIYGHQLVAN